MKTFNRTFLVDAITYSGEIYHRNDAITSAMEKNNTNLKNISFALRLQGRKAILVNCLSKNLKGKTDLHGRPYKPSKHIYTTN